MVGKVDKAHTPAQHAHKNHTLSLEVREERGDDEGPKMKGKVDKAHTPAQRTHKMHTLPSVEGQRRGDEGLAGKRVGGLAKVVRSRIADTWSTNSWI